MVQFRFCGSQSRGRGWPLSSIQDKMGINVQFFNVDRHAMTEPVDPVKPDAAASGSAEAVKRRPLTPAAQRALAEAEARRQADRDTAAARPEIGGRGGADPVRYGDWEIGGRAIDF